MGMFDDKQYLTGENGHYHVGDEFTVESAELSGQIRIQGREVSECYLVIDGERYYTAGASIVNQVARMDNGDLPRKVRLDTIPTSRGDSFILRPV